MTAVDIVSYIIVNVHVHLDSQDLEWSVFWICIYCQLNVQVYKCQYQLINNIKYTETIEHQGLEALTGSPVQKVVRYFEKV